MDPIVVDVTADPTATGRLLPLPEPGPGWLRIGMVEWRVNDDPVRAFRSQDRDFWRQGIDKPVRWVWTDDSKTTFLWFDHAPKRPIIRLVTQAQAGIVETTNGFGPGQPRFVRPFGFFKALIGPWVWAHDPEGGLAVEIMEGDLTTLWARHQQRIAEQPLALHNAIDLFREIDGHARQISHTHVTRRILLVFVLQLMLVAAGWAAFWPWPGSPLSFKALAVFLLPLGIGVLSHAIGPAAGMLARHMPHSLRSTNPSDWMTRFLLWTDDHAQLTSASPSHLLQQRRVFLDNLLDDPLLKPNTRELVEGRKDRLDALITGGGMLMDGHNAGGLSPEE